MAWYIPILIFIARICDVSIGTTRIILVIRGRKVIAALAGVIEIFIWVLAISAVITHLHESWWAVVAYAAGFGCGTLVGMVIEEKLALGQQVLRVVNTDPHLYVAQHLRNLRYIVTEVEAHGLSGPAELCLLVVQRKEAHQVFKHILEYCPKAFVTIEDVRSSTSRSGLFNEVPSKVPLWKRVVKYR